MNRISSAVVAQPARVDGKSLGRPQVDGMLVSGHHELDHDEGDIEDYSEEHAEVGGYGVGMVDGSEGEEDSDLEGEGLLWGDSTSNDNPSLSTSFTSQDTSLVAPTMESNSLDEFDSDPHRPLTRLVPPTPESSRNKRVSFSGSVRIARGIGSTSSVFKSPPIAPPNAVDFLSVSPSSSSARPPSRTSSANHSPATSQSGFEGGSTGVPPSFFYSTSHLPRNSLSQLSLPHYFPTMTRSSSPCSSIYAPLTESRTTFTSPMDIRPPVRHRPSTRCVAPDCPRRQSKRSRTWIGWFSRRVSEPQRNAEGESLCCEAAGEAWATPPGELEEGGREYRDLVEEQRRRYRRNKRRTLSMGWSPQTGTEGTSAAGERGWVKRIFRGGSYGTFVPTSAPTNVDTIESESLSPPRIPRANKSATRKSKTAADVAFGPAPRRWLSLSWFVWKMKCIGTRLRERWGEWRGRRKGEGEEAEGEEEHMYRPM